MIFSKLETTLIGAVGLAVVAIGLILYGAHYERLKQTAAYGQAVAAKEAQVKEAKDAAARLTRQLTAAQGAEKVIYKSITKYIPKKEVIYVNNQAINNGPITVSFGDLWVLNRATEGSLTVPAGPYGLAGSAADSGVTLQSVLGNYVHNAAVCLHNTQQLTALIAWERAARR